MEVVPNTFSYLTDGGLLPFGRIFIEHFVFTLFDILTFCIYLGAIGYPGPTLFVRRIYRPTILLLRFCRLLVLSRSCGGVAGPVWSNASKILIKCWKLYRRLFSHQILFYSFFLPIYLWWNWAHKVYTYISSELISVLGFTSCCPFVQHLTTRNLGLNNICLFLDRLEFLLCCKLPLIG
jgi:hypothetical protein